MSFTFIQSITTSSEQENNKISNKGFGKCKGKIVIQVRAGALEAKLKALTLHLLQRGAPHGNGIIEEDPTAQPFQRGTTLVDLNGTLQQEPVFQPVTNYMPTMQWNGVIQHEPADQSVSNQATPFGANIHVTGSGSSHGFSKDDEHKIQADCLAAIALQLLLKLKRHLKIVYSLNDARCQNIPFDLSETHTTLPTTHQELVQRYQEFKNALREDTVDYSTYTANIKRKRPAPRKGRKSVGGDDDGDDDDEDWTGGARRLSNSGRRGNYSRSRQRL
ncbi:unnamed protein product [Prunus armeniaca]|uniref:Uncharacterized protein n=1 Tax=Prunus armeniaca TaxID=36596 RepID=A0A6J5WXV8_PRUAR|nr:unnamed protein product [Prunus armeniaca]